MKVYKLEKKIMPSGATRFDFEEFEEYEIDEKLENEKQVFVEFNNKYFVIANNGNEMCSNCSLAAKDNFCSCSLIVIGKRTDYYYFKEVPEYQVLFS